MKKLSTLMVLLTFMVPCLFGQEQEWEPQKQITGYVGTEWNYFQNIHRYDKNMTYDRDYALSLSEAGLLANYQPTKKLTIKAVFVYRPDFTFDQMLNEVNAEYSFAEYFKVKAGRFLTPLSPMNTYYYAPVNTTATLPMIISHHEYFPLNMDAVSVNGKIGENLKVDYDVFAGGFRNALWLRTGALGFFGDEDNFMQDSIMTGNFNQTLSFGGGMHVGFSFQDYVTVGFNTFRSTESLKMPMGPMILVFDADKKTYGINIKLKFSTLQFLGETWHTDLKLTNVPLLEYKGSFAELSNSFGKVTPYIRFEHHDAAANIYDRYTGGINYKPMFETTLKLEYLKYQSSKKDLDGIVATVIYSF